MITIHKTDLMAMAVGVKCSKLWALVELQLLGFAFAKVEPKQLQLAVPESELLSWEPAAMCWMLLVNLESR